MCSTFAIILSSICCFPSVILSNSPSIPQLSLNKIGDEHFLIKKFARPMHNWFEANAFCSGHGLRLVTVTSQRKSKDLFNYFATHPGKNDTTQFWAAASNLSDRSEWIWFNIGKPVQFSQWPVTAQTPSANIAATEPPASETDCLSARCLQLSLIAGTASRPLMWHARDCSQMYATVICETFKVI